MLHLPDRRLRQFLAAMPECDVPETREAVNEFTAVGRVQPGAFTLNPDEGLLLIVGMK